MMIMANHPQQQQQQQTRHSAAGGGGGVVGGAQYFDGNSKKLEQQQASNRSKPHHFIANPPNHQQTTSEPAVVKPTIGGTREAEQEGNSKQIQDGKRTLIKNQLYLIEQLQLENANLRNERDQLQLENEELKFQLQMISSSNILSQPNSAFDSQRQLERLVESDEETKLEELRVGAAAESIPTQTATTTHSAPVDASTSRHSSNPGRPDCVASIHSHAGASDNNHCDRQSNSNPATAADGCSGPTRPTAHNNKSLGQPIRLIDDDAADVDGGADNGFMNANRNNNDHHRRPHQRQTSSACGGGLQLATDCKQGIDSRLQRPLVAAADGNHGENSSASVGQNLMASQQARGYAHLGAQDAAARRDTNNDDDDDDDDGQLRAKQVERLYGDDSEKVQAAAVTIQRAFRRYQICKRFRTITEQLRHTCQSSSPPNSTPITSERYERETTTAAATSDTARAALSASSTGNQSSIAFVSGSTKAAAWESLSYAASKLAASAAAATATTKQVLTNGVTKSASSQHVNSSGSAAGGVAGATSADMTPVHLSGGAQTAPSEKVISAEQQRPLKSSNSVVAAAINFQQLESIRKRQYRVGLNIFNKSPEKGVSFLIAHSFIDASTPYAKSSPGYYLSNQMHFIDKQHLAGGQNRPLSEGRQQQQQQRQHDNKLLSPLNFSSCQFCFEEENLKRNVAHFLLHRKGLAKEKIGQYLGNLQCQFNQDVLRYYLQELDFYGLQIDIALRKFLATLRLPGEAQKIERFVDCFAQRYVQCQQQQQQQQTVVVGQMAPPNQRNQKPGQQSLPSTPTAKNNYKNNLTLLSRDEIFILTFAIIMLNTDLHSPSLKPTSRMSSSQFIHNLRGVFKSQTINESDLTEIYERVKANQITTTPDHVTHVMKVQQGLTVVTNFQKKELPNLCVPHRRLVCFCRLFEVYDINKKERIGQHQREIFLFNDMLLVTKLARRARANTPQQYAYRQSIALQGLYVQLFQTAHYNFGIRLCRKSNDETLIMFNARNELDQSRFVDDLSESIAEMDEMESIRSHNVIETIHSRCQGRLRRHAAMHNPYENLDRPTSLDVGEGELAAKYVDADSRVLMIEENLNTSRNDLLDLSDSSSTTNSASADGPDSASKRRLKSKFNSMSNLASVEETKCDSSSDRPAGSGMRQNRSFVQGFQQRQVTNNQLTPEQGRRDANTSGRTQQSCSSASVHSLDSGLFLSRDVSPNQSG